jgi:hypothetical protein
LWWAAGAIAMMVAHGLTNVSGSEQRSWPLLYVNGLVLTQWSLIAIGIGIGFLFWCLAWVGGGPQAVGDESVLGASSSDS